MLFQNIILFPFRREGRFGSDSMGYNPSRVRLKFQSGAVCSRILLLKDEILYACRLLGLLYAPLRNYAELPIPSTLQRSLGWHGETYQHNG